MISREEANKTIGAARLENPKAALAARIGMLPTALAKTMFEYLEIKADGAQLEWSNDPKEDRQQIRKARHEAFIAISEAEFDLVIEAWFPKFAHLVRPALELDDVASAYWSKYWRKKSKPTRTEAVNRLMAWRNHTTHYDQSLEWMAEYAGYYYGFKEMIPLYVASINTGETAILEMFLATCNNEHPVSVMGDHVLQTLLQTHNPQGWTMVGKLLLAAQRQEGLRQSIFDAIKTAHPEAQKQMLHLMLNNDLLRFSSSVMWAVGYLPLLPTEPTPKVLESALREYLERLENPKQSRAFLKNTKVFPDANEFYKVIQVLARQDLDETVSLLLPWLEHKEADWRFLALHGLLYLQHRDDAFNQKLEALLSDPDDRLVVLAFRYFHFHHQELAIRQQRFILLEKILLRFPEKVVAEPIATWTQPETLEPDKIFDKMLELIREDNPRIMLPYRLRLNEATQSQLLQALAQKMPWDAEVRELVNNGLQSRDDSIRSKTIRLVKHNKVQLEEHELLPLEKVLTRKGADIRKEIIGFLLEQPATLAAASAARLTSAKNAELQKAGSEIQRALEKKTSSQPDFSATNGFGLFNPAACTPATPLEVKNPVLVTDAARRCLESLSALVRQHLQVVVPMLQWDGSTQDVPLENFYFYNPQKLSLEEHWKTFPLHDVWESWHSNRTKDLRDPDGLELARAMMLYGIAEYLSRRAYYARYSNSLFDTFADSWLGGWGIQQNEFQNEPRLTYVVLQQLLYIHSTAATHEFALDIFEHQLASGIPLIAAEFERLKNLPTPQDEKEANQIKNQLHNVSHIGTSAIALDLPITTRALEQKQRDWRVQHAAQILMPWRHQRQMWGLELALETGCATQDDLWDWLIGPDCWHTAEAANCRTEFAEFTTKKPHRLLEPYPHLKPMVDACVQRILELELERGDLVTPTSRAAAQIRHLEGMETLFKLLAVLQKDNIARVGQYVWGEQSRVAVFSRLLRVCHPAPSDTAKEFAKTVKAAKIPDQRLLELGLFAPQWVNFVTHTLGWKGLDEAMFWLLAHTKESGWSGNQQDLEGWKAEMAQLTPLSTQDLMDGAVDVAWFHRAYKELGVERWGQLYDAAKYTSSGTGHARAKQFADAMLGKLLETDIEKRIVEKRHQDSVRSYGLLPLPKQKDAALLKRYTLLQAFAKASKQFGSQRKESEGLSFRIGLENLARTAGYPDPMRLEWAMEIQAVADLSKGAILETRGDTEFKLSVSEDGVPEFSISKNGKPLKDIPAAHKKDEAVLELRARRKQLETQNSRMRQSLERAMIHGDEFTVKELHDLQKHPLVRPMLEKLVFIDGLQFGFFAGKNLVSATGELLEIAGKTLRLAHPTDFFAAKNWAEFQQNFFVAQRQQPFKQIFRELYVPTPPELDAKTFSSRYAGHQVNPQQSVALLGSRGWVVPFEDDPSRTFFSEGITAHVQRKYGYTTPAEVEAPAMDTIYFTKRNHWEHLPLETINPRLFSEVMRDLDLVVSVAHVGGVDPEASQSTTEMRAALLLETLRLLKIGNVKLEKSVALIAGKIGKYSVHLGSATVHQQPGGAVCLVAVPNQARGRIFLPFADADPRTAEVIAKVLMLAKDDEIQDPILLRQLVG